MKNRAFRGVAAILALTMLAAPLVATTAQADPRGRGRGREEYRGNRGGRDRDDGRGWYGFRGDRGNRGLPYVRGPVYRDRYAYRYHERGSYSPVLPFLGGVVLGAVIGNRSSCPPPAPRVRVYVYDCPYCDYEYRDYDSYVDHLIMYHHIPACNINSQFPPYTYGYWTEY